MKPGFLSSWGPLLGALGLCLGGITLVLFLWAPDPWMGLGVFFTGIFSHPLYIGNWLSGAGLLALGALGASLALRSGVINLGGEGQIYAGAWITGVLGLGLAGISGPLGIGILLLAALMLGGTLGGLSAGLQRWTQADPMITTFLISLAVIPLVDWSLSLPGIRDPADLFNQASAPIPQEFWFSRLWPPSKLHLGALVVLPLLVLSAGLLFKTRLGYLWKMTALAPAFIRSQGWARAGVQIGPLTLSGGLHGLLGAFLVLGQTHAVVQGFSFGLGWNALTAALIARAHPWGLLPGALLLTFLDQSAQLLVIRGQIPFGLSALIPGIFLLVITLGQTRRTGGGSA